MPIIPTGGLSIILNITILVIGFLIKSVQKLGLNLRPLFTVFALFVDKKSNSYARNFLGYSVCTSIFTFMIATTTSSLVDRLRNDSNYDLVINAVRIVEAKMTTIDYTSNFVVANDEKTNEYPVHTVLPVHKHKSVVPLYQKHDAYYYQTTSFILGVTSTNTTNLAVLNTN